MLNKNVHIRIMDGINQSGNCRQNGAAISWSENGTYLTDWPLREIMNINVRIANDQFTSYDIHSAGTNDAILDVSRPGISTLTVSFAFA